MKHLILMGLALASLVSRAENCFIDGANTPRCAGPGQYSGVSWPVYTDDEPAKVWAESLRRAHDELGVDLFDHSNYRPSVRNLRVNSPKDFPDIICLVFGGPKETKICFDTMEITER